MNIQELWGRYRRPFFIASTGLGLLLTVNIVLLRLQTGLASVDSCAVAVAGAVPVGTNMPVVGHSYHNNSSIPQSKDFDKQIESKIKEEITKWNEARIARSFEFFKFYSPEEASLFEGKPFQEYCSQAKKEFKEAPWIDSFCDEISIEKRDGLWVSSFKQYLRGPHKTMEGICRLFWNRNQDGELKIVGMTWFEKKLDLEEVYLEHVMFNIVPFIEAWRCAWERGDIEKYSFFYTEEAVQGHRKGKSAIVRHKRMAWAEEKPKEVSFSGMRVMAVKEGIQVDMAQKYRGVGYCDKGIKTLLLRPLGTSWAIVREDWSKNEQDSN